MIIFPAIDIKDGKAVRLFQGDYNKMTVYSENPVETARRFKENGASHLHIVDLDGAKDGRLVNFETIKRIVDDVLMFVQTGGGIRDEQRIAQYIDLGVNRVILGTAAVKDFDFLRAMVKKYGGRIAVSVDVWDGYVAVSGWREKTDIDGMEFCEKLVDAGVETVIYTDISKDGGLAGTNLDAYDELLKIKGLNIIASGGISFESEIIKLRDKNIYGAILGKALYSGALDIKKAIELGE
jgi:phosphoribosylformimino-5-aminoimidazole carboxamide ribotide isomerase